MHYILRSDAFETLAIGPLAFIGQHCCDATLKEFQPLTEDRLQMTSMLGYVSLQETSLETFQALVAVRQCPRKAPRPGFQLTSGATKHPSEVKEAATPSLVQTRRSVATLRLKDAIWQWAGS